MSRRWIGLMMVAGFAGSVFAQEPAAVRPALLFREEWKQPPYTGEINDEKRRLTQAAVGNANLELKMYGGARDISVSPHEGREDLWTGLTALPSAVTLRDKANYFDLTGLARMRWITRTISLHRVHPVLKLADGTLVVGSHSDSTAEEFLQSEVAFQSQRWFRLDPEKVAIGVEVKNPDLSKVDEIGFADLMPGGGHHGYVGAVNVSVIELYAKAVPRAR